MSFNDSNLSVCKPPTSTVYICKLALEQFEAPSLTLLESGASVPNLEQQGAPRSPAQILSDLGPDSKSQ
jgi:hypothetical protein